MNKRILYGVIIFFALTSILSADALRSGILGEETPILIELTPNITQTTNNYNNTYEGLQPLGYGLYNDSSSFYLNWTELNATMDARDDAGGGSYDLNYSGDSGSGVILNSEILSLVGSGIVSTSASGNTLTITGTEADPHWSENFTAYNSSWSASGTDTHKIPTGYGVYNDSATWNLNWTELNDTMDARDDAGGGSYDLNISDGRDGDDVIEDGDELMFEFESDYPLQFSIGGKTVTLQNLSAFTMASETTDWDKNSSDDITVELDPHWSENFTLYNSSWSAGGTDTFAGNWSGYNKTAWDLAYSWGDHAVAGYLTSYTELDPHWSENFTLYNSSWSTDTNTQRSNSEIWNICENDTAVSIDWNMIMNGSVSITESQISDLQSYLTSYTELDPHWTGNKTLYNSSWSTDTDTWNTSSEVWNIAENQTSINNEWVRTNNGSVLDTTHPVITTDNINTTSTAWVSRICLTGGTGSCDYFVNGSGFYGLVSGQQTRIYNNGSGWLIDGG